VRRLGKYELLVRLASGGAAHVFLARDTSAPSPGRLVALKVLQPSLALNGEFLQMFFTEARIASHLHHPNLVTIAGFGEVDGVQCLALEYVFGASLADVLRASARAQRPMSVGVLLSLTASICDALHYAHELADERGRPMGLVHRDVTPQNILIGFNGVPKLTDFGIAKATGRGWETQAGIVKGKFSYMSPEQAMGKHVDRRSDIFGVGIVLWEALTGHDLFKGTTPAEVIASIRDQKIPSPSEVVSGLTPIVDPIVARALQRSPRRRYATAREMGDDIRGLIHRAGVTIDAPAISKELAEIHGDVIADRAFALRGAMSGRPDLARLARVLGAHPVDDRLLPELGRADGPPARAGSRSEARRTSTPARGTTSASPDPGSVPGPSGAWEETTDGQVPADELLRMLSTEDVTVGQLPSQFRRQFEAGRASDAEALGRVEAEPAAGGPEADGAAPAGASTATGPLTPRTVAGWDEADSDDALEALPTASQPDLEPTVGPAYRPLVQAPGTDDIRPATPARALPSGADTDPTDAADPPPDASEPGHPAAGPPGAVAGDDSEVTRAAFIASDPRYRAGIQVSTTTLVVAAATLFGVGLGVGLWLAAG